MLKVLLNKMRIIKAQLSDEDHRAFMLKVKEQFGGGRGSVRKFLEWIANNKFAVLDPNLRTMLKALPLKS